MKGHRFVVAPALIIALFFSAAGSTSAAMLDPAILGAHAFVEVGLQGGGIFLPDEQGPVKPEALASVNVGPAHASADVATLLGAATIILNATADDPNPTTGAERRPLAVAEGDLSDGISLCVRHPARCDPLTIDPSIRLLPGPFSLTVRIQTASAGLNAPRLAGTSATVEVEYAGSLESDILQPGSGETHTPNVVSGTILIGLGLGEVDFTFGGLTLDQLSTEQFFSVADMISAVCIASQQGTTCPHTVTFQDPISFTLLDANGDVVPGLEVVSQLGVFYGITGGAAPPSVPQAATATLVLTGLVGLGLVRRFQA